MAQNATTRRRRRRGFAKSQLNGIDNVALYMRRLKSDAQKYATVCSNFAATETEEQSAQEIAGDNNRDAQRVRDWKR